MSVVCYNISSANIGKCKTELHSVYPCEYFIPHVGYLLFTVLYCILHVLYKKYSYTEATINLLCIISP